MLSFFKKPSSKTSTSEAETLEMVVDLDNFRIGEILSVGDTFNRKAEKLEAIGATLYGSDDSVTGFHVRFKKDWIWKGQIFKGCLLKNGKLFELKDITPQMMRKEFGEPVMDWDDPTEFNYQFTDKGMRIEFSWLYTASGNLDFSYVDVDEDYQKPHEANQALDG